MVSEMNKRQLIAPAKSLCSTTSPTRSSVRKIAGSRLRMPSPKIGFFEASGNTQSYSKARNLTNIKRKSLKEDSGSLKSKVVTYMKTKKDESNGLSRPSCSKHRQLRVDKSLDWDTAFFTNEGLLNNEEIRIINKGLTKADGTRKGVSSHVQSEGVGSKIVSILRQSLDWDTAFASKGLLNPEELCMVNDGFKKAESSQSSTKSQTLPHTIASASPKCMRRKISYKNTKQTTCFSYTSPPSSSHGVLYPSKFQRPPRHPLCRNSNERKFTSQDATSSLRNVMPSGLRMPSPRLGFFDVVC